MRTLRVLSPNEIMYKKLLSAVAVLGFAASTMGCVEDSSTMFIRQVVKPDVDDSCIATDDPGATFYTNGVLDVAYTDSYRAYLLVGNQIMARANKDTFRSETAAVQLESVEATIFANGAEVGFIEQPIAGFIDASSGTAPSFGVTSAFLADGASTAALDTSGGQQYQLVSRVKAFGRTLGGLEVETGFFDFPIRLCRELDGTGCTGCYATDPDDEMKNPCRAGQETPDCKYRAAVLGF